jgi:plasmid stabilization system protein ParE
MAKYQIIWSESAQNDLIEILEFYINRNKSANYSSKLYTEINKSVMLLEDKPLLGISTDIKNVRYLVKDKFEIIYEVFENQKSILIIMIWPSEMDPSKKDISKRL